MLSVDSFSLNRCSFGCRTVWSHGFSYEPRPLGAADSQTPGKVRRGRIQNVVFLLKLGQHCLEHKLQFFTLFSGAIGTGDCKIGAGGRSTVILFNLLYLRIMVEKMLKIIPSMVWRCLSEKWTKKRRKRPCDLCTKIRALMSPYRTNLPI